MSYGVVWCFFCKRFSFKTLNNFFLFGQFFFPLLDYFLNLHSLEAKTLGKACLVGFMCIIRPASKPSFSCSQRKNKMSISSPTTPHQRHPTKVNFLRKIPNPLISPSILCIGHCGFAHKVDPSTVSLGDTTKLSYNFCQAPDAPVWLLPHFVLLQYNRHVPFVDSV